jgi:hypothetical protein
LSAVWRLLTVSIQPNFHRTKSGGKKLRPEIVRAVSEFTADSGELRSGSGV